MLTKDCVVKCSVCGVTLGEQHKDDCPYHMYTKIPARTYDENYSCPTCSGRKAEKSEEFTVPFDVQKFMFDIISDSALSHIASLIEARRGAILNTAEDRHADGFVGYGSEMYQWTPEVRLRNVLEELADAVVYLTSGPIA